MTACRDQVISASRRTDIPAWYTPWFMDRIQQGRFEIKNPFSRKVRWVDVTPDNTHSIVFWSKNYGPFLELEAERVLAAMGFRLYFNFTVNSHSPVLEPNLPNLKVRLRQAEVLAGRFGPETVAWRFDPICFYTVGPNTLKNNLNDFKMIADAMAGFGITRCVTSFYDPYKKVDQRIRYLRQSGDPAFSFLDPHDSEKIGIIRQMSEYLTRKNIRLHLCCEKALLDGLKSEKATVRANACIDGRRLKKIFGGNPVLARDTGQRTQKGCHCSKSVDVGSYRDHPCRHNCLFCYAATQLDEQMRLSTRTNNENPIP